MVRSMGIGLLKMNHLYPTPGNPVNVATLYEAFLQYDDKPMITGIDAVVNTIRKYRYNGEFNVAFGERGNYSRIYHREEILDLDVTDRQYWLVDKNVSLPNEKGTTDNGGNGGKEGSFTSPGGNATSPGGESFDSKRHFKEIKVSGKIPMEQWTQLFTSFIVPLSQNNLEIEVSFKAKSTASNPLDESSRIYKVVRESARQLGLRLEEED